jgi:uncharacterized protein (TIGR02001 family)
LRPCPRSALPRTHSAGATRHTDCICGVSQTRGEPAVQADLHYQTSSGWFLGAWASSVDLNRGPGATVELNAYAGRSWPVSTSWNAKFTAVHYAYPNDTASLRYDYDELIGSLAFRDWILASVAWSPNTSRYSSRGVAIDRTAVTYDLAGRWPLFGPVVASGSAGYYDLDDLFGTGYGYWSAGVAVVLAHLQFDLGYFSAADRATDLFGPETTGARWSFTAAWQFGGH